MPDIHSRSTRTKIDALASSGPPRSRGVGNGADRNEVVNLSNFAHDSAAVQNRAPVFAFVACGPTPIDRETRRFVRKHVMRDIGRARRRERYTKKLKEPQLQVKEVPADFEIAGTCRSTSESSDTEIDLDSPGNALLETIEVSTDETTTPEETTTFIAKDEGPIVFGGDYSFACTKDHAPQFSTLGAGRSDPFIKYPFELDSATRGLLDYGKPGRRVF